MEYKQASSFHFLNQSQPNYSEITNHGQQSTEESNHPGREKSFPLINQSKLKSSIFSGLRSNKVDTEISVIKTRHKDLYKLEDLPGDLDTHGESIIIGVESEEIEEINDAYKDILEELGNGEKYNSFLIFSHSQVMPGRQRKTWMR